LKIEGEILRLRGKFFASESVDTRFGDRFLSLAEENIRNQSREVGSFGKTLLVKAAGQDEGR
jgi:hypothetical protein